jgi:hypothetical protein
MSVIVQFSPFKDFIISHYYKMQTYYGNFNSTSYLPYFVYGKFEILLDKNKKEYETSFELTYQGLYKRGQTINEKLYIQDNKITANIGPFQRLEFVITDDVDDIFHGKIVKGTYTSNMPDDQGTFEIYTYPNHYSCAIC